MARNEETTCHLSKLLTTNGFIAIIQHTELRCTPGKYAIVQSSPLDSSVALARQRKRARCVLSRISPFIAPTVWSEQEQAAAIHKWTRNYIHQIFHFIAFSFCFHKLSSIQIGNVRPCHYYQRLEDVCLITIRHTIFFLFVSFLLFGDDDDDDFEG